MAGTTLYKHTDSTTAVDGDAWPDSGLKDADGNELYYFAGDEGDSTNGASADWVVSTPVTTPESDTTVTTPTPTDPDVVANAQPADAVTASTTVTGDTVVPTTNTPGDPASGVDPDVVSATSSDVVGGPELVTEAPEVAPADAPAPFEGTTSVADRAEADAATEAVQADNAADTAAVAAAQAKADAEFRVENPYSPVVRAANPNVGGESF